MTHRDSTRCPERNSPLALFGKKKDDDTGETPKASKDQMYALEPEKAASFFKHAQTVEQTGNYEYATTLWLQGLRQDPSSMTGLESFYKVAQRFSAERGKPGPTRDQSRPFGIKDSHKGVERYLETLLEFGTRPGDIGAAVRAMAAAATIEQAEAAYWIGERALAWAAQDPKVKKDTLLKIMQTARDCGAFDMAVKAGELALNKDRSDSKLADEIRNLSAQATMTKGGYTDVEQGGGFRSSIRDASAQRALEEQDRLVKGEDTANRVLEQARQDYESRPSDRHSIARYVRALIENESEENEREAIRVLERAWEDTEEFQFRKEMGKLQIRKARRQEREAAAKLKANPGDEALKDELGKAQTLRQSIEIEVVKAQADAYPTDLSLKYELGRLYHLAGQDKDAIALLQQAVKDARHRIDALDYLGRSFKRIGWIDESISVLRQAIEAEKASGTSISLDRRYALMNALHSKAENDNDADAADEAAQLASSIAMEKIDYEDILERREAIQELQKQLKAGA